MFDIIKYYEHIFIKYGGVTIIALTPYGKDLKLCNYEVITFTNYRVVGIDDV
jgi:hypothetical protein